MARKTVVRLVDDLDGSDAVETVVFGIDNRTYEIDLNATHAAALRESYAPYLRSARKVGRPGVSPRGARGGRPTATTPSAGGGDYDPRAVRIWAAAHGIAVAPRGRIPSGVIAQFRAAGN